MSWNLSAGPLQLECMVSAWPRNELNSNDAENIDDIAPTKTLKQRSIFIELIDLIKASINVRIASDVL